MKNILNSNFNSSFIYSIMFESFDKFKEVRIIPLQILISIVVFSSKVVSLIRIILGLLEFSELLVLIGKMVEQSNQVSRFLSLGFFCIGECLLCVLMRLFKLVL